MAFDRLRVTGSNPGMPGGGGNVGGRGRIAVYYVTGFAASFTPHYLQKQAAADSLFNDDFETGDLSRWTSSTTDNGDLSVSTPASYWGNDGMQAVINDNNSIYAEDDSPQAETLYRARFYVNPNTLTMASGDVLDLFSGENAGSDVFHVQMQKVPNSMFDNNNAAFQYQGSWTQGSEAGNYNSTVAYSSTTGDSATFTFTGDQFILYYTSYINRGSLDIYIDGTQVTTLNEYSSPMVHQNTWTSALLTNGPHTVRFVVSSTGNKWTEIDAVKVFNTYQVRAGLLNNAGTWTDTNWYSIEDNWTAVEISYQALANDGALTLTLNGAQQQSLTRIDNSTRTVTEMRLGAQGIETGTRGTVYFDDFDSRRFSAIGILPDPGKDVTVAPAPQGWVSRAYVYASATQTAGDFTYRQPHAVTSVTSDQSPMGQFTYDQNGNMTCRVENGVTYKQDYNTENRLSNVSKLDGDCATGTILESWLFVYDGDGNRTMQSHFTGLSTTSDSATAYFMGGAYEVSGTISNSTLTQTGSVKYYFVAGQTVAMLDSSDNTGLKYLLTDHLGSVMVVASANGALVSQQRYLPFGEVRSDLNPAYITQTGFGYTGQRALSGMGLMDYKFRFYDAALMRFVSSDSIIPSVSTPQSWNRYSYAINNPIKYNDPSGHTVCSDDLYSGGRCQSVIDYKISICPICQTNIYAKRLYRSILKYANELPPGFTPELLLAMARQESGGDAVPYQNSTVPSPNGGGALQITPESGLCGLNPGQQSCYFGDTQAEYDRNVKDAITLINEDYGYAQAQAKENAHFHYLYTDPPLGYGAGNQDVLTAAITVLYYNGGTGWNDPNNRYSYLNDPSNKPFVGKVAGWLGSDVPNQFGVNADPVLILILQSVQADVNYSVP